MSFDVNAEVKLQKELRRDGPPEQFSLSRFEKKAVELRMRYALKGPAILSEEQKKVQQALETLSANSYGWENHIVPWRLLRAELLSVVSQKMDRRDISACMHIFFTFMNIERGSASGNTENLAEGKKALASEFGLLGRHAFTKLLIQTLGPSEDLFPLLLCPLSFRVFSAPPLAMKKEDLAWIEKCIRAVDLAVKFTKFYFEMHKKEVLKMPAFTKFQEETQSELGVLRKMIHSLSPLLEGKVEENWHKFPEIVKEVSQAYDASTSLFTSCCKHRDNFIELLQDRLAGEAFEQLLSSCKDLVLLVQLRLDCIKEAYLKFKADIDLFLELIPIPTNSIRVSFFSLLLKEIFKCLQEEDANEFFLALLHKLHPFSKNYFSKHHQEAFTGFQELKEELHAYSKQLPPLRLQQLITLLSGCVEHGFRHLFFSVGTEREMKAQDLSLFADVLEVSFSLSRHHANYLQKILNLPPSIQTMNERLIKRLQLTLASAKKHLEAGMDKNLLLIKYFNQYLSFEKEINEIEIRLQQALEAGELTQDCAIQAIRVSKTFFKIFMHINIGFFSYALEDGLTSPPKQKEKVQKEREMLGFISAQEEAAAPPREEKVPSLDQLKGQIAAARGEGRELILRHYLVILEEILQGPIIGWQPSLVAEEAFSKCALLLEQILKLRLEMQESLSEKLRFEHNLTKLFDALGILLSNEEGMLVRLLFGLNANQTEEICKPAILQELSEDMRLHTDVFYDRVDVLDEEELKKQFGEDQTLWGKKLEERISKKIQEVKDIIQNILLFAVKLASPFGIAKQFPLEMSDWRRREGADALYRDESIAKAMDEERGRADAQRSPPERYGQRELLGIAAPLELEKVAAQKPEVKQLTALQKQTEKMAEVVSKLKKRQIEALPLQGESVLDFQLRNASMRNYLESLAKTIEDLRRSLLYPICAEERTYKTILGTQLARTVELAQLTALAHKNLLDEATSRHPLYSYIPGAHAKRLRHSHALQQFQCILNVPVEGGSLALFEGHLKVHARYPNFVKEVSAADFIRAGKQALEIVFHTLELLTTSPNP